MIKCYKILGFFSIVFQTTCCLLAIWGVAYALNIVNKCGSALCQSKWSESWYFCKCSDCESCTEKGSVTEEDGTLVFRLETSAYKKLFSKWSWDEERFLQKTSAVLDELLLTRYNVSCCRITSGLLPVKSRQLRVCRSLTHRATSPLNDGHLLKLMWFR